MSRSGGCQHHWRTRVLVPLGLCTVLAAAPGCRWFEWSRSLDSPGERQASEPTTRSLLGEVPVSRDAIELEILFVERPLGDPLLGGALWDEVDEVTIPLPQRRSLRAHGFLTGVTGKAPPRALETLLGRSWDVPDDKKRIAGHRIAVPSGGEYEVPTNYYSPERTINVPLPEGGTGDRSYENCRGVMRLRAYRLQDGFARLEFVPEIHHGPIVNRYSATPAEWRYSAGQKVERLYGQRFSVDLNIGEFALVSTNLSDPDSVGHHFFVVSDDDGDDRTIHRLLIVRLSGMAKSGGARAE
ncbi:MAG TPA: hypothetical protein VML55_08585 [Planctomycetaceae bacterium]|nr:hypothetical protein [Planctomycetaceae bacterium]